MQNYRKLKTLGRGLHGEVWLVEREEGAFFAMKRIRAESQSQLREVELLQKLQHEHIVQYFESFEEEGVVCIVMEYLEGGDLGNKIKTARETNFAFSESQVLKWLSQLLVALQYIHSQKVIHRDLKTHNIFLTEDENLQIGDFGLSRILNFSDELASSCVGTPYYLAPEICRGEGYDSKADLWSLGCILYELCQLKRPFEGENLAAIVNSILNREATPLPETYSEELRNLIFSLLKKDKSERPCLQELLEGPLLQPFLTDNSRKLRKPYQREISINIPTQTYFPPKSESKHPSSAPSAPKTSSFEDMANVTTAKNFPATSEPTKAEANTARACQRHFTFCESLLKQCPNSPNRPLLMCDFLKRKLGEDVYERVKRVLQNTKDPAKLLKQEPWIISDICGEENLSIIDVGIAFQAFNAETNVPYPPTSTHKLQPTRAFPILRKPSS